MRTNQTVNGQHKLYELKTRIRLCKGSSFVDLHQKLGYSPKSFVVVFDSDLLHFSPRLMAIRHPR